MKHTIIDTKKLKNVTSACKGSERVTIAQCPACAATGYDLSNGNHLIIYPGGAIACVLHPGEDGKEHRKKVLELVGIATAMAPRAKRPQPRPLGRIPTKITYIKLNIRPEAEPTEGV